MYGILSGTWRTPHGSQVTMHYRADTNDWNTIAACMTGDEYKLPKGLVGWALDIGAYVGSVTVPLLVDNPGLRVVAVEPVPSNVDLLRRNLETNGVTDRCIVVDGAVAGPTDVSVTVFYGYRGTESLEHHAFVGNSTLAYDTGGETDHDERKVAPHSLSDLLAMCDGPVVFAKIDCEGCEFAVLSDPAVTQIPFWTGEWHNVRGKTEADVRLLLDGFEVTFSGPPDGPGGFEAVRNG